MKFASSRVAAGVSSLLCLTLCVSSCTTSPEVKAARFIENGKKQLTSKKDPRRAILEFQNAIKFAPQNAEAYFQLASAYLAAGDGAQAGIALRKALGLNPKHQGARRLIARLMASTNEKEYLQDAQTRLHDLLAQSPDDADELYSLALTELKLNQPGEAARDFELVISTAPHALMASAMLAQTKLQTNDIKGAEAVLTQALRNSPKSADAVVILGRFYVALKRFPEAEQEFNKALALNPNDSGALFNLGSVQNETGEKPEAERTFRKLSVTQDKRLRTSLAAFLSQEGRTDESLHELDRLANEDPADLATRTLLINGYVAAKRVPDAEKLLNGVLKKNPKDLDALLERGELAVVAGNFNPAELDLNQVVRLRPTSPEVHYVLARLYLARKEDLRFRQELNRVLEINPYLVKARVDLAGALIAGKTSAGAQAALDILNGAPPAQRTLPAVVAQRNWALWGTGDGAGMRKGIDEGLAAGKSTEFLLQDGLWRLRWSNGAGARASLEQALDLNPSDIRALAALRQSMASQKQPTEALQKVREYASKQPKSAPVQEFLGVMLATQGRQEEARQAFIAAKNADPQSVAADLSLVQMDVAAKKVGNAEQRLLQVISTHPDNTTARLWMGILEDSHGNKAAALDDFRKVVQNDPGNAQALNNLAYELTDFGNQPNEALKYAEKAQQIAPDNPQYADTTGWILYQKGLYSSAVQQLQRAGSQNGPTVWKIHLAMAYAKTGDVKRGRELLAAVLKNNPNLPEAKAAKDLIEPGK